MDGDDLPERPDPEDCPFCPDGTLETELDSGLRAVGATRRPVLIHRTECDSCPAERTTRVLLEELDPYRTDVRQWPPGQGSLEDHA